jgi:hypothetical protein
MMATKTHIDKVVAAAGNVRPKTAAEIGKKLGYADHKGVAKALKQAVDQGKLVKGEKGYRRT